MKGFFPVQIALARLLATESYTHRRKISSVLHSGFRGCSRGNSKCSMYIHIKRIPVAVTAGSHVLAQPSWLCDQIRWSWARCD